LTVGVNGEKTKLQKEYAHRASFNHKYVSELEIPVGNRGKWDS